jgi:hypothetical protein
MYIINTEKKLEKKAKISKESQQSSNSSTQQPINEQGLERILKNIGQSKSKHEHLRI